MLTSSCRPFAPVPFDVGTWPGISGYDAIRRNGRSSTSFRLRRSAPSSTRGIETMMSSPLPACGLGMPVRFSPSGWRGRRPAASACDPTTGGSVDEGAQSRVGSQVPAANRRSPTTHCSFLAISSIPGLVSRGDGALAAGGRLTETSLAAGRAERGYRIFTSSVGERWKLDGGS